jgi:hypothetical protein
VTLFVGSLYLQDHLGLRSMWAGFAFVPLALACAAGGLCLTIGVALSGAWRLAEGAYLVPAAAVLACAAVMTLLSAAYRSRGAEESV